MSCRRAPIVVAYPAKPCRVAARFRPAALAVEYLVYVPADATGTSTRPSKRIYEMDVERLVAARTPAAEAVAQLLASADWPERLGGRKVSSAQLTRLYTMIVDARASEVSSSVASAASTDPASDESSVPELRRSCEPKFKVGEAQRAAAERRFAQQHTGGRSRYQSQYHNLCGSADLDEALRLSRTGNALTKLARMTLALGDEDEDELSLHPLDSSEDSAEVYDYAGLL